MPRRRIPDRARHSPPGRRFAVRFFVTLLACSAGFWVTDLHLRLGPLQRAIVWGSVGLQHVLGGRAVANGTQIATPTLVLDINHECTGIFVVLLYTSFVLAYPATWRARVGALGIGIPSILAVNVLRLATLARLVEIYPSAFFYFHEYVWQGVLSAGVLVGAIAWAERYG